MTREEVRDEIGERLEKGGVPHHLRDAILRYLLGGIRPGDFLSAVISNNLFEAIGSADKESRDGLFSICSFFYNEVPAPCFGSPAKMETWLEKSESSKRLRERCFGISEEGPPTEQEEKR